MPASEFTSALAASGPDRAHRARLKNVERLARSRRIIFVNRYFHPDHSATSQMLSDLAFALAREGEAVSVVASRQLYEDPAARLSSYEHVNGVRVHRCGSSRFGRVGLLGRAIDYLSFHLTAATTLARASRRGDIVVALTDPPLLSVTAAVIASAKGLKLVNWLQDLYPEVAFESGVRFIDGWMGKLLLWARNRSLDSAAANVAIGETMASRVGGAVPAAMVATISNWTKDSEIVPTDSSAELRKEWALEGKFVVGYSGNLGKAHEVDTLIEAAEVLKDRKDITFLVVGGGSGLKHLRAEALRRGLNFVFKPYQKRERLPMTLTLPDIHWLSLKAELEGLILPSKFYGIAAAGRPMILIGAEDGELARLIRTENCGHAVRENDHAALASAIRTLADDAAARDAMGKNARRLIDSAYSMDKAIGKWKNLLADPTTADAA